MTTNFYVFHGDDSLSIDESVNKLRKDMGGDINAEMNITELDGTSATVPEIIGAVTSYPFLSDRRLVIVKGLIAWLTRKGAGKPGKDGVKRLIEEVPNLPEYSRLVLVERKAISDKNAIIKLAKETNNAYLRAFNAPKDSTSWIINRAHDEYGIKLEPMVASALSEVTGDDLRLADNELCKLVIYVGEGQPITEQDVAALTPYVPEASVWDMVDAIAVGNGDKALRLLHRLLADKDEDPFKTFGMIIRQFRLMLLAREHLASGGSEAGVANAIGVKAYPARKAAQQSRGFSVKDLEIIYRQLCDLDLKMKTGGIKPELALDMFVTGVAK
jgi:DNA polymerase III subunit delta